MAIDRVPLWRGDHVPIKQLAEDFARYSYLLRLKDSAVLVAAIRDGLGLLLWHQESFAYADSFDEAGGRYRGLRCGEVVALSAETLSGLLVKPDVARRQQEAEAPTATGASTGTPGDATATVPRGSATTLPPPPAALTRFHGTVTLDPTRVGRDAGRVADEVIAHLAGLVGASLKVTLEIEAQIPPGAPENVVRIVTENSRTLKFTSQGFETE